MSRHRQFPFVRASILVPLSALAFLLPPIPSASALPPWVAAVDHPFPVSQAVALTGDDGLIYIFGGSNGGVVQSSARSFDPATDTYTPIASMPFAARGACGVTLNDGRMAIFGGFNNDHLTQTQIYDPMLDAWVQGAPQIGGWECAAAIDDAGMVHLVGGEASSLTHGIYDPVGDAWIAGAPSPVGRLSHGAARGFDGRIYVFGGDQSLNTLDIFDPLTNLWSAGAAMPGDNQQFATVGTGDEIYAIGGSTEYLNDGPPYFDSVWIYDVATNSWMVDTEMLVTATREACAAIDGNGVVHVFGGSNGASLSTHQVSLVDSDGDGDGIPDPVDNCPADANPMQEDADMDGLGDVCDACPDDADNDVDMDLFCGDVDNCPDDANDLQEDADMDGLGDVCDACPDDADNDIDGDNVCGDVDNCPNDANEDQADADDNGIGDACDGTEDSSGGTTGGSDDGTADGTAGDTTAASASGGVSAGTGVSVGSVSIGGSDDSGSDDGGSGGGSGGDEGCSCRTDPQRAPIGGLLALTVLGLLTRRRRR